MLRKVLVPLDGSTLAEGILDHVRGIVSRPGVELILFRAIEPSARDDIEDRTVIRREARRYFDVLESRIRRDGIEVRTEIVSGDPAEAILEASVRITPSLIAMSTHGRSGIRRWIRGSVAERVLRRASFPVLMATSSSYAAVVPGETVSYRRILVPLDGSPRSARILPLVTDLARIYGSEVELLHVVFSHLTAMPWGMVEHAKQRAEAEEKILPDRERLAKLGIPVTTKVVLGDPAEGILSESNLHPPDLIAMTTHGRSGVAKWTFGGVAEKVLHETARPMLVYRTVGTDPREGEAEAVGLASGLTR